MKFGMLLPHCGEYCSPERLIEGSRKLEEWGYDSIWVRDHLLWHPHGMEGTNQTFVDAFITLAAVAGATSRITLGTAVLIPIRWPIKVAQNFASLSYISQRQVEAGFGMGANPAEFAGAGFRVEDREQIFVETLQICKRIWAENDVTWHGEKFHFEDVTIEPKPIGPIPTWYGGSTIASVRRAVRYCDGWLPGRLPMATLDQRLEVLRRLNEEEGRQCRAGVIPVVCVDHNRQRALERIDVAALSTSSEGSTRWIKPPSGEWRTVEDLRGLLVFGTPEECVEQIKEFEARGVELFMFDLRLQFDEYLEAAELIGREVLPHCR
jgi:alkanesulfonate monooxygenase SsuD/methylene tetrahydromethanopterin reductase-like flavin-dependent oxidoreductase (luciferase family)